MSDEIERAGDKSRRPEQLYIEALAAAGPDELPDLEELCTRHPAHASELRGLHACWGSMRALLSNEALPNSKGQRHDSALGPEIGPKLSLEAEPSSDFASEALRRLEQRGALPGRYRPKREIGRGAQGSVLQVWDSELSRNLAMKVAARQTEAEDATEGLDSRALARFLEEAQVTSQLDHPGIVPVHELGIDEQRRVYFTMKLVKGESLNEVLQHSAEGKAGWTQTRVVSVLLKVCDALGYAHSKGVLHRDLKPANVMVGRFGEVYVMDWGLARVMNRPDGRDLRLNPAGGVSISEVASQRRDLRGVSPDSPLVTMDGDIVGTPVYMSPEQARGELEDLKPASDVYALGAMLYHLLAGHPPYAEPGARTSPYLVLRWVREDPPAPLARRAPGASAELVSICERAMARDPRERYASAEALAEDLQAYIEGRVVKAHASGAWAEARKWVQRNRGFAAGVLIALLAISTLVGFMLNSAAQARLAWVRAGVNRDFNMLHELGRGPLYSTLRDGPWVESWIAKYEALLERIEIHREDLQELRALALPRTEEEVFADAKRHPSYARVVQLRTALELIGREETLPTSLTLAEGWKEPSSIIGDESYFATEVNKDLARKKLDALVADSEDPDRDTSLRSEARDLARIQAQVKAGDIELAVRKIVKLREDQTSRDTEQGLADQTRQLLEEWELERGSLRKLADETRIGLANQSRQVLETGNCLAGARLAQIAMKLGPDAELEGLLTQATEDARAELARLEEEVRATRRTWTLPEIEDQWRADGIERVLDELRALPEGLPQVLAKARAELFQSLAGPEAVEAWAQAREEGLDIPPQLGLLPLGRDEATGRWLFWLVASGVRPGTSSPPELSGLTMTLVEPESGPGHFIAYDTEIGIQWVHKAVYLKKGTEFVQDLGWIQFTDTGATAFHLEDLLARHGLRRAQPEEVLRGRGSTSHTVTFEDGVLVGETWEGVHIVKPLLLE